MISLDFFFLEVFFLEKKPHHKTSKSRNVILESDDPVSPENPSFKADYSTLTGIRATKKGTKLAFYMFALDHKLFFESCLPLTVSHSGSKGLKPAKNKFT